MTLSKAQFRRNSLEQMKKLPQHNRLYRNALFQKMLRKSLKLELRKGTLNILLYYPLPFEADVVKLLKQLRTKHNIYIPFMEGESFKMVPFRLPLKKKKFDIFEAGNTNRNIKKIDIAIVPAVGVDRNLQRVGFGKGMYDRFFARLQKRPTIIFTQPILCYTDKSLCDSHDIHCDSLVTPKQIVTKKLGSNIRK